MIIRVNDPKKNCEVVAGDYNPDTRIFSKQVKNSNIYRGNNGVGIDLRVLQQVGTMKCMTIVCEVLDGPQRGRYVSDIMDWSPVNSEILAWGHGIQYCTSLDDMVKEPVKPNHASGCKCSDCDQWRTNVVDNMLKG